jgi:LmbE family N-acetylglucosaminyl deacetylase
MNLRPYLKKAYSLVMQTVYSKTHYKMFLKKSFEDIDRENLRCRLLMDILPKQILPLSIKAPFSDKMLVVAPHQDDESIGCGGAIAAQLDKNKSVQLLFVTDGGNEFAALGFKNRQALVEKREQEVRDVCRFSGINTDPIFLRVEQMSEKADEVIGRLRQAILDTQPKTIFTPFFIDAAEEHVHTTHYLAEALKTVPDDVVLYCYEVWSHVIPNVVLDITPYIEKKKKMIALHESQCRATDYVNSTLGINMYNARLLGNQCRYAERFFEVPKKEFIRISNQMNAPVE